MLSSSFDAAVAAAGMIAGAIASVTGFAIGSLLTPLLGFQLGTKLAVAAVSIPHAIGTGLRLWLLGAAIDRRVFLTFGLTSAAGGLAGALMYERMSGPWLSVVFGALLLFVSASELSGLARRMRFHGAFALVAGAGSGFLGGLVGNQGGIRSAALLGADLPKKTFVATATAVGLIVDAARVPIYLSTTRRDLLGLWTTIALASAGVVAGTFLGNRILTRIPESAFRPIVAVILAMLGVAMLITGLAGAG
jgi:uncharacterized membrane protein YfcA